MVELKLKWWVNCDLPFSPKKKKRKEEEKVIDKESTITYVPQFRMHSTVSGSKDQNVGSLQEMIVDKTN